MDLINNFPRTGLESFHQRCFANIVEVLEDYKGSLSINIFQLHVLNLIGTKPNIPQEFKRELKGVTCRLIIKQVQENYQIEIGYYRHQFRYNFVENEDKQDLANICLAINNFYRISNNLKIKVKDGFVKLNFLLHLKEISIKKKVQTRVKEMMRAVGQIPLIFYRFFKLHSEVKYKDAVTVIYQHQQAWEGVHQQAQPCQVQESSQKNLCILKNVDRSQQKSFDLGLKNPRNLLYQVLAKAKEGVTAQNIAEQQWTEFNKKVVWKTKNQDLQIDGINEENVAFQVKNLKNIRHLNLKCQQLGVYYLQVKNEEGQIEDDEDTILFEDWLYCDKYSWSLNYFLTKKKKLKDFIDAFYGIARGLLYLKKKQIIHYDIKPQNIMVDQKTNKIKIIDYGACQHLRSKEHLDQIRKIADDEEKQTKKVNEMKKRMTKNYYYSNLQFQDLFNLNFDLYGFAKSMGSSKISEIKILESKRNELGQQNYQALNKIITECKKKPSQINITIEKIASQFQQFSEHTVQRRIQSIISS